MVCSPASQPKSHHPTTSRSNVSFRLGSFQCLTVQLSSPFQSISSDIDLICISSTSKFVGNFDDMICPKNHWTLLERGLDVYSRVWDVQTTSFEIPWFLGWMLNPPICSLSSQCFRWSKMPSSPTARAALFQWRISPKIKLRGCFLIVRGWMISYLSFVSSMINW